MSSDADVVGIPPPTAPRARFADILFAEHVLDPAGGNPKGRRVVVLTPDDALAAGFPIVAAPVTSQIMSVPGAEHVVLPFRNPPGTRHPATGLTRRAGIVANWLVIVDPATIADHGRRPRQDGHSGQGPRWLALIAPGRIRRMLRERVFQ